MTKKPRDVILDPGEDRWKQNILVGREVAGGQIQAVNATATPLDAYRYIGVITARQYDAGNWLRDTWIRAGRQPHTTITFERIGGKHQMSDAQARAWAKITAKLKRLDPVAASCVWNVCCMCEGAEFWARRMGKPGHVGLVILKEALSAVWNSSKKKTKKARKLRRACVSKRG